ncbi:MAG: YojF family protein [Thermoflavifilum sp.]|nr:YojF family protein [Thermoflavifilum sp.]MCL6514852.1 YojF family protein [Alicyclobacillus sp.]
MEAIRKEAVQEMLDRFRGQEVYLHLETTNGAYAAHRGENPLAVCAYIRNGRIRYHRGLITGQGPYRVGLRTEDGWVYAEGLTDYEIDKEGRLLLAGHDPEGRLAIALELSATPFRV